MFQEALGYIQLVLSVAEEMCTCTCYSKDSASGFEAFLNDDDKKLMHFNCMEWLPFRNYAVGLAIQSVP